MAYSGESFWGLKGYCAAILSIPAVTIRYLSNLEFTWKREHYWP
jgi:hypothetical protein